MNDSIDPSLLERARRASDRASCDLNNQASEPEPGEVARLEDAVRRLPRLQREIFLAVRFGDYSYADIIERTGLTAAQIERQFARSMLNLTRNLDHPHRYWWRRWFG